MPGTNTKSGCDRRSKLRNNFGISATSNEWARAYIDVGEVLMEGFDGYDALRALELAIALGRTCGDREAVAAGFYHCGVMCRTLGLPVEALEQLDAAQASFGSDPLPSVLRDLIESERDVNLRLTSDGQVADSER